MPIAAAIPAVLGVGASIYSANKASKANNQAINAQQAATDQNAALQQQALAQQQAQYDQSRADQQPWQQAGAAALGQLSTAYGLGGQPADYSNFTASPDYQFSLDQGMRALNARNAALGQTNSGAAQKSALQYATGLASQNFNSYANRLSQIAGLGTSANAANANAGQNLASAYGNYASNLGNLNTNQANNLASSYGQQAGNASTLGSNLAGIGSGLIQNLWGKNMSGFTPNNPISYQTPAPITNSINPNPAGFSSQLPSYNFSY